MLDTIDQEDRFNFLTGIVRTPKGTIRGVVLAEVHNGVVGFRGKVFIHSIYSVAKSRVFISNLPSEGMLVRAVFEVRGVHFFVGRLIFLL